MWESARIDGKRSRKSFGKNVEEVDKVLKTLESKRLRRRFEVEVSSRQKTSCRHTAAPSEVGFCTPEPSIYALVHQGKVHCSSRLPWVETRDCISCILRTKSLHPASCIVATADIPEWKEDKRMKEGGGRAVNETAL